MGIRTVLISTRSGVLMPNKSLPQVSGRQISFVIKVGKYATTDVQVELDTNSAIHRQCPLVFGFNYIGWTRYGAANLIVPLVGVVVQRTSDHATPFKDHLWPGWHFINTVLRQQYGFFFAIT
jgi:hypothetical protein